MGKVSWVQSKVFMQVGRIIFNTFRAVSSLSLQKKAVPAANRMKMNEDMGMTEGP